MNGHASLNRIFRVVWNASLGVWQVASELTRGKGKTKSSRLGTRGLAKLSAGSILVLCHAGALAELPTGGQVTAGSGTINDPVNGRLVVNQSSDKMAIDWQGFSVGTANSVQFIQPSAEAIALNRVLGGDPSVIRGSISANGRIVLLNPNGILFGPTSKVEVASLLASTLSMSNEDFMVGNFRLEGDSRNAVTNQGSITAKDGGFVALVAGKIENVGDIRVRGGEVLMGVGRKVRLDLGGPIRIEVDEAVVDGYIRNGGLVKAEGGTVVMTVKTAGELASFAINNEGIIEASSLARGDGGTIRLLGEGGTVVNSGTLDASSADGKGGHIEVTGARVGILDGGMIDASGAAGGGTVLLGGDYQGKNAAVDNAKLSFVGEDAKVRANATREGDGGKVIVWSDDRTNYYGSIEARGGAEGGNGGFVEVSGKQYLDFQGTVDTSAAKGRNGTLLLDPTNLTIGNINSSGWITNNSNVFGDFTTDTNPNPAHDFSFLRVDVLLAALANNDITVQSACDAANCVGTITVQDAISWNSGKALTLDATGSIFINAAIDSTGAAGTRGGDFNANAASGDIQVNANITTQGGNVNLNAAAGSVMLGNSAVISTAGSAAAAGSNAAGGAAGNITLNSTSGIALNDGRLLAAGGAGDGAGAVGAGGRINLVSTTGAITQSGGGQIVGGELLLQSDSGAINLTGSNAVEKIAAQSNTGNIAFRNANTAGLTVADIGGVSGVTTGGNGSIQLTARNLQLDANVTSNTGAITLNANNGQQTGDFSGVVLNGTNLTTQGGNITISGRGGDADGGSQAGVMLANGATVNAGGAGTVTVTGVGGSSTGDANHGVVIAGTGSADTGTITSAGGAVTVNATGGSTGNNNHALVFNNNGQIGTSASNHAVTVKTTVGAGADSVTYASDATGGYIGTGSGNLILEGDVLSANGGTPGLNAPVAVRSTGSLTLRSTSASFSNPFSLAAFNGNFSFNSAAGGLGDIAALTIGKSGNTAAINIDDALSLAGKSVTLTGGDINLDKGITAGTLNAAASGNINQSEAEGSFTLGTANLSSGDSITLKGVTNSANALTATATNAITFDNGTNALNLNGTLQAASVHLKAGSLNQTGGTINAGSLEVTSSNGGVTLNQNNKVGTLAADANGGNLTFNNGGSSDALTVGAVGDTVGVRSTGTVTFNNIRDLQINEALSAGTGVTVNAVGGRNIDLGTETADKLSLTDAEIDRIAAPSLTLNTSGNVTNSADVRAGQLSAMTISAGQGITNSGAGQLGFSNTDTGALTLTSTGTADNTGVGTAASSLVTVGASELVLNAARDIRVDARTRAGGSASANLDKLHINSTSAAASDSSFSVLSTAGLSLTRGTAPSWHQGDYPTVKGTYNISLTNTDALDFRFIGNAPVRVSGASNIGAASFALESIYGINVANAITGTSGTISLKANSGGTQTGNFIGVNVGAAIQTANGSIVLEGRGGNGRNAGDFNNDQSNQYGVNIASTLNATAGGSISVTGYGGSSSSNGSNHDGVTIGGAVTATNGSIAINGTGGSGYWQGTTSDGVSLTGTGYISNSGGSVQLGGASGSGINSRAVVQQGTGIITAGGLEVISRTSGRVVLTNNNNVGVLAADVTTGFDFDNGNHNLAIGMVNGRQGISETSSGEIGLYDIPALTVNESISMQSGTLRIAADTIAIADGKSIGNSSAGGARTVNVDLRGRADIGQSSSRNVSIGVADAAKLSVTNDFLGKVYAGSLTLNTSGAIDVMADTNFINIGSGLTLNGGTINNANDRYLNLSAAGNNGWVSLNGTSVGSSTHAILTRGANSISASSGSNINVKAYTDDTGATELIKLRSLSIDSSSGGANLDYLVEAAGLNYAVTGNGTSYAINASAIDTPVDFSFTGNAPVAIVASSDMKGGAFNARATSGNVTVNDGVAITAGHVGLDAANAVVVGNGATINSSSAWLEGDNAITFSGTGALTASGSITLRTTNAGGTLSTDAGAITSTGSGVNVEVDSVNLGTGGMSAAAGSNIEFNTVTNGRTVQLGGASEGAGLSLTAAELGRMSAGSLVIGRGGQNDAPGAISFTGAVDLTGKIGTLTLRGYNSTVTQSAGANLTVDTLNISANSGAVTLNQNNAIRNFQASTNGAITLNNIGALDVTGLTSRGNAISVTTTGDLQLKSGSQISSIANTSNTNAGGGAITLQSTGGKLTVLGNVSADGYAYNGTSSQQGGVITLRGQSVEVGAVSLNSRGSGNSTNGAQGGHAGSLVIDATDINGGAITLDGTTINLTGGWGGTNGSQGNGSNLTFSDAVLLASLSGSSTPSTVTINAGGGAVQFGSVNGGASVGNNLTVNSSRWNGTATVRGSASFTQAVGAANAIGNLTLNNVQNVSLADVRAAGISIGNTEGSTTLTGALNTNGATGININSSSIVATGVGYTTTGGGNIALATKGALNLADTSAFNSSGNIDLKADDGITVSGATLQTAGAGIIFRSATTLASDLAIDTTGAGTVATGGNVEFQNTLNSSGGARDLTITAGTNGDVIFNGAVGSNSKLDTVTIGSARNVTTSNAFRATSFTQNAGNGTTTFGGATTTLDSALNFTGNALTVNGTFFSDAAVTINNAGLFSTGAGSSLMAIGGFTQSGSGASRLSGSISTGTTSGNDISFAGPVTAAGTVSLSTGVASDGQADGDIRFAGTLDNASSAYSGSVTLTAGDGEIAFGGNIGATTALGSLTINSSKDVVLPASVTASSLSTNAGGSTIVQDGAVISTSGVQSYGDAFTLNGDATLASTGNGAITFSGTVNGAHDLVVNTGGVTTFAGAVGGSTALASLTTDAGGTVAVNGGSVTTTGSQSYGDAMQLGADTSFTSTGNADISFAGTVNSAGASRALQVNTAGATTFGGAVGNTLALASINVADQAGTLLLNGGSFRTTGAQTYNSGTIILGGNTTLQSTAAGAITLGGNVDAAICTVASLDVLTQGATVFGGAIGTYRPLWSVTTDGLASVPGNTVSFNNGTVVTLANQTYGELAILGANTSLKSLGQGDISFNGPVRAAVDGQQSLTVDTSGDIVFNAAVGDNGQRLASFDAGQSIDGKVQVNGGGITTTGTQVYRQQVALGNDAILTGSTGSFDVGINANNRDLTLRFSGPTELEGTKFTGVRNLTSDGAGVTRMSGTVETSGKQTYDSNVVLAADAVLKSTGAGSDGDIALNGTVDGAHGLRIETAGKTDLAGAVGGTTALASLSTDGPGVTTIGANVRTSGAQTYGDAVQMTADATLASTGGGNIVFAGKVDGPNGLTVNTAGTTRFEDEVGGTTALASLATDGAGSVVINGGTVTTTGAQTYGDAVTLGADTTLASTSNGEVRFNGTVDGAHKLAVNTGGATSFAGAVGGTSALTSITTDGPGVTTISGGSVRTTGAQNYGDGVALGGNTTLTSTGNGDVVFGGTVNGPYSLAVNTGGTTEFDGEVGGTTALASLTTDGTGTVKIDGGGITTTGGQNYGDAVTLGANTALKSTQGGNIVFTGAVNGPHQLDVRTGGTTRFDATVGGTSELASLTTGGNVSINGGSVKTSGAQNYENAVNLGVNTVLASSNNGDIRFGGTLDGGHALAVETGGTTAFEGAVGGKTALASITTDADGAAVINGGLVRTSGEQKFNDGVTIGKHTLFASNGPVSFVSTLDGPWDVTVNTPGVATFGGAIGSISPIASLKGGSGAGTIDILGPSITASGSLILEEAVHVKNKTVVKVGKDALFYGDAKSGKSLLDVTAGGRIQYGRPVDNIKNYLPTLFTLGTQAAAQSRPMTEVNTPVSVALMDGTSSRQLGVGNLQVVNVTPAAGPAGDTGSTATQNVSESAVNQAVGQIAGDDSARSMTYILTVKGGVRVPDESMENSQ